MDVRELHDVGGGVERTDAFDELPRFGSSAKQNARRLTFGGVVWHNSGVFGGKPETGSFEIAVPRGCAASAPAPERGQTANRGKTPEVQPCGASAEIAETRQTPARRT